MADWRALNQVPVRPVLASARARAAANGGPTHSNLQFATGIERTERRGAQHRRLLDRIFQIRDGTWFVRARGVCERCAGIEVEDNLVGPFGSEDAARAFIESLAYAIASG